MSFDRFRAQTVCEDILGCATFDDFFQADFPSLVLDSSNAFRYNNSLKEDASDFFYKGYLSLQEGLSNFSQKNYSWGVIKLYYSVFYMIRADLAIRDYGLIRHKAIYYLEAKDGASPITKGRVGPNRAKYSGDHKSAMNYYKDLFENSDILLSQNIEGMHSYEWLMKKRERVNYQERYFNEPDFPDFLSHINSEIQAGRFLSLIDEIINDGYIKTFQPEYATLAIPIKRVLITRKFFSDNGVKLTVNDEKKAHLKSYNSIYLFDFD